ncbi:RluA family pseudouridine synthase [Entomobacter blattae]|uniref:Pseudouridine synthase n=1 Tax=Entomobacter blattae TaxID=2762277 RepID=A0A7H1NT86_9PROT|nr:RluA family pseudouridine synthase [Entomobacter blattae]QNT78996.1 Ribosomal large subunit pseudouridine synthase D [Entomobacter blattae]
MKNSSSTYTYVVSAEDIAETKPRADRLLADQLPLSLSRSRIKTLIEQGHITRNHAPFTEPARQVHEGDVFELILPAPVSTRPQAEEIDLAILYEDDHLLVLNKSAGMVVHPAPGNETGTMVNALLSHCGHTLPGIGGEIRPGIIHRLDKDTSGVMVVAKTEQALTSLSHQFAERSINRRYLALCWGRLPSQGSIEGPIGRDPKDRKKMAVVNRNGKYALTSYQSLLYFGEAITFLECKLATGRTHQIRVHMAHSQHPLLGDPLYLRRIHPAAKTLSKHLKTLALDYPYQALHATLLGFSHPATDQYMEFSTPVPQTMKTLIDELCLEYGEKARYDAS